MPSCLRSATITAPVVLRTRSSRIVRPACGYSRRDLDLLEAQVGAAVRGDDLEERRHLRLERELRHLDAGGRVRPHDAVGAGERELALGLGVGGARDDRQVGPPRSAPRA